MVGLRAWATRRRSSVLLVLDALGGVSWVVLGLLLALVWGSFVGFATRSWHEDRPGGDAMAPAPPYDAFEEIEQARRRLFDATVVHTNPRALRLVADAPPRRFRVEVRGARPRTELGGTHTVVRAGTQIGVKLHCTGAAVRCTPLSSERQYVLTREDVAVWVWEVRAERAGTFGIALTITSYLRDTDTVLAEELSPAWTVRAVEPPEDDGWVSWARDLWRQVADAITGLGGLAVSLSAIAAVAAMVIRRRLPALGPEDEEAAESVRGAAPGSRPRPAPRVRSRPGRAGAARNLRYTRRIRARAGPRT
ncbi:hypothetical protein [Streptomyces sp. Go-475]|uniref:hypothetical protein n=1 Tax=Streptomyces sp. Go-475 TaxID=2072505 RepID=UPI000DEF872C|nr:hypothetical protein [Streptomyces sp. Go-475]AXE84519.1 hypothetical protein C1703_05865 [Streptomyces sp. Go-475]